MNASDIERLLFGSSSVMLVSALLTFLGLSFFAAPYGKYSASKGFGPLVPAQIAWCFMEIPNLWVAAIVYAYRSNVSDPAISGQVNKVALFCFLLHYVNRSIIYPYRMRSSACTPMPVSVMFAALIFCSWNGFNQSASLILVNHNPAKISDLQSIVGLAVFAAGFYINVTSDSILISARKHGDKAANGGSKYVIPTGGMFRYVSCANYFGEIVEWWGFALLCGTYTGLSFALYTTAYLSSRAFHYHAWYKEKFEDYPRDRKAVFPFVM